MELGDLRGPFDGQILDQASGNPISGALIYATWAYDHRSEVPTPATSQTASVVTKSDGSYELPRIRSLDQAGIVLRRFTLIAYKAGYLGYRSDLRTDDHKPRHDFAQRGLKIRLDRFPDGESHARHLAFLGGGAALRKAAQAEVVLAALELSEATKAPATGKEPDSDARPVEPAGGAAELNLKPGP